jgi:uncharacterized protein
MKKNKPPIVFDTNALLSGLMIEGSISHQALDIALGHYTLLSSAAAWTELETRSKKHSIARYFPTDQERLNVLARLNQSIRHITVRSVVTDCGDADDNKFLELALDGKSFVIVSGDRELKKLSPWRGVTILGTGDFVRAFAAGHR